MLASDTLAPVGALGSMPPVRMVHVVTRFLRSGSERMIAAAVEAADQLGIEQELIVGRDHYPDAVRELCGDIPVTVEPHLVRDPHAFHDPIAWVRLRRHIAQGRYDIVHTCQSKAGVLARTAAASVKPRPAVLHTLAMANFGVGFGRFKSVFFRHFERLAASVTDRYLDCGTDLRDRFLQAGIGSPERHTVIGVPLDLAEARNINRWTIRRRLDLSPDTRVIASVAALDVRKGVLDLPNIVEALCRDEVPTRFLVAGEGGLRGRLEEEISRRGIGHIIQLIGYYDPARALIAAADCVVLPSRAEGIPIVLVEATALGTPWVAYPVDGAQELLKAGADGAVVPFGDTEALVNRVRELATRRLPATPDCSRWERPKVVERYREQFRYATQRDVRVWGGVEMPE